MQLHSRVLLAESLDSLGLVGRQVVEDDMNLSPSVRGVY